MSQDSIKKYSDTSHPKVFVRHIGGSGGGFIITLLRSFSTGTTHLSNAYVGHHNQEYLTSVQEHNFHNHGGDQVLYSTTETLENKIDHVKKKYFFSSTDYPFFVCHTHVPDPDPLMLAFENTKLINILFEPFELDQIIYNFVTKIFLEDSKLFAELIARLKKQIPDQFTEQDTLNSLVKNTDRMVKLVKIANQSNIKNFLNHKYEFSYPKLDIKFSDIRNKSIINQLDQIAEFVEVELTEERKYNAIQMINQYANNQKHYTCVEDNATR